MSSKLLLPLVVLCCLAGCVGTIEDTEIEKSKSASTKIQRLPFNGLTKATPIANDKVEVYFVPATGNPEVITYEIYVNNTKTPIFISGTALKPNAAGQLVYIVGGLTVNTTYSFSVSAANNLTGAKSDPGKSLQATTFGNTTANFLGITSVRLPAGSQGQSTVIVEWVPAESKGSTFSPKIADPVAYEVTYISEDAGVALINDPSILPPLRVVSTIPSPIPASPQLSSERSRTITGLASGKKYFFQVRAIHKGYVDFGPPNGDPNYVREKNNKFLAITTTVATGVFDFAADSVSVVHPPSDKALSALDIKWDPAEGDFYNYRVFIKPANASTDPDILTTVDITAAMAPCLAPVCRTVDSDASFVRIESLDPYRPYQVKVVACRQPTCDEGAGRIESLMVLNPDTTLASTTPTLAPFDGINYLDHARSVAEASVGTIHAVFNPAVVNSGYLTDLKVFCYDGLNDPSPEELKLGVTYPGGGQTPKLGCNGLTRITASPSSLTSFSSFKEISIEGTVPNSGKEYCVSIFPVIDADGDGETGDNSFYEWTDISGIAGAIKKCIVPVRKVPNLEQFTGKQPTCSVSTTSLTLNWSAPTSGMYTNYAVFLKEASGRPFRFAEATSNDPFDQALPPNDPGLIDPLDPGGTPYIRYYGILPGVTSHTFTGLTPGKRYYSGVLAYLDDGTNDYVYSEYNLNTGDCLISMPVANFEEWIDIFAVGPKIDGMTPPDYVTGKPTYIFETLDADGIPVEVWIDDTLPSPNDRNLVHSDYVYENEVEATTFDGVPGVKNGDLANFGGARYAYSNRGIVKLAWQDVTFFGGTKSMWDFIDEFEPTGPLPLKKDRKYGYRIYRSDNNKVTWKDLTLNSSHPFQRVNNDGLIRTPDTDYQWRRRSNAAVENTRVVTFTDYSVINAESVNSVDRARIYWYKIVPILNGAPAPFSTEDNIVKVVLPPANMALVNRKIANRMTCNMLGVPTAAPPAPKDLDKTPNGHYTCDYNGIGASSLTLPWRTDQMVFDARGDLLVDRFEMGCNWTRGGLNPSINSSYDTQPSSVINPGAAGLDKFTGLTMTFLPLSSAGNNFKGCTGRLDDNNWSYQPGISDSSFPAYAPNDSVVPLDQDADGTVSWKRIRPGDCVGSYGNTIAFSACADDSKAYKYPFHFPGMKDDGNNCTTGQTMDNINWDLYHTQSEYAAVFYNRLKSSNYAFNSYQGAGGNPLILDYDSAGSSCYINLPYANAASQWRARWIPVSSLGQAGLGHAGSGPGVQFPSLWTKTIDEIQTGAAFAGNLNYNPFYDPGNNINPITFPATTRFAKNTTPIARIITSNNAKLPPIAHLSQEDMHDVCTSYKVEVGTYNDTSSNFVALEPVKNKRLPRKKETILYSAWPEHYDATKIVNIQRGTFTAPPVDDTFGGTDNQSCKTGNKTTPFNGQWQAFANYFLTPGYPNNSSENNVVLMTGTSPLDNGSQNNITRAYDTNTQKCVSRWGVQDVVGNLSEMTTDQVFCNFSTEELWVSPAGNAGDQAKGIIASGLYGALYRGGISANPLAYWVVHLPGTGQCSSIENGPGRAWPVANPPLIYSIFDPATPSGYNTSFIKTFNSADQESIEDMRNGDGYFLDFGEVNIASPISEDNMLGIQNPVGNLMRAKYFNPVVGIPLECGAGTCAATEDNTLFGTDTWVSAAYLTGTEGHVLPGFPVHNDYAYSDGIGILSAPALRFDFPTTSLGLPATINYLDTVDTGGVAPYYTIAAADPLVTPVKLYYQYWKVYRNRPLIFYIGGSTADGSVGRYTYHFRGYSIAEMRNNWSTGFRCIVRVSEGD